MTLLFSGSQGLGDSDGGGGAVLAVSQPRSLPLSAKSFLQPQVHCLGLAAQWPGCAGSSVQGGRHLPASSEIRVTCEVFLQDIGLHGVFQVTAVCQG